MHTCIFYGYFYSSDTDFKDKLVSGEIPSLTKANDIATVHWRNYSTQHDSKRAVQQPTANPGTGHRVKPSTNTGNGKQSRKDYKHQKRPNSRMPDWKIALCVKSVMKKKMKLTKEDLKTERQKKTSLDELSRHQQLETRTIENMRLSLLAVEVYGRS